jgi:propanediol dehydratase small subunit
VLFLFGIMALLAALGLGALVIKRGPELYEERQCMGRLWRRAFPASPKEDIRQFLWFFASAFAIPRRQALLLKPGDELIAIYRARYPDNGGLDAMEFELLAKRLHKIYRLSLEQIWHEGLTVGELFERLNDSRAGSRA